MDICPRYMPSFTFVSTANAFVLRGAVPVFVDIRPDTLNIDEALIEAAITPRTKAICVVHYAGVSCEMDAIMASCTRPSIVRLSLTYAQSGDNHRPVRARSPASSTPDAESELMNPGDNSRRNASSARAPATLIATCVLPGSNANLPLVATHGSPRDAARPEGAMTFEIGSQRSDEALGRCVIP